MKKQSVSEVVGQIRNLLEGEFKFLSIEGEVTNLSSSASGHWYFSLSDKDALISCALFKMDAFRNPLIKKIKDGDKIVCSGNIGVYAKRGTFQLIVQKIEVVGAGDLKEQFEKLKKKLASEGFFDLERKKKIPELPKNVAIITAPGGAALQDFINVYKRRSLWMNLLLVPALVQGEGATKTLIFALKKVIDFSKVNPQKAIDVIVLSRGGGSLEDLWAFNDEGLARAIFDCPIPVISAVGHQVDFSISDFVADFRAETPTAAAEILTQQQTKIREKMDLIRRRLNNGISMIFSFHQDRLQRLKPRSIVDKLWNIFLQYQKRLLACDLTRFNIREMTLLLDDIFGKLKTLINSNYDENRVRVERSEGLLNAINPGRVLARGYSILQTAKGCVVSDLNNFKGLPQTESLEIRFVDGKGKVQKSE